MQNRRTIEVREVIGSVVFGSVLLVVVVFSAASLW